MGQTGVNDINRLIGEFTDLQETWEKDPAHFDWTRLETLARDGAQAYNEGAGPSFHALALDGVEHHVFHERFLEFLLKAGFDAFRLARPGTGVAPIPVIDHASLREAADINPSSARMHALLMQVARERFAAVAEQAATHGGIDPETAQVVAACAESLPADLLERIAPELLSPRQTGRRRRSVDPVEGYLSSAEVIVEGSHVPYG
ncbi:hypothetical protein [Noviherbaspirillum sp. ST9]|uniref:hypothetical protein n=1 Tax=Noviherbaspirillum sp. ST9 TaxID=3401606 RepID=UPI003B587825